MIEDRLRPDTLEIRREIALGGALFGGVLDLVFGSQTDIPNS